MVLKFPIRKPWLLALHMAVPHRAPADGVVIRDAGMARPGTGTGVHPVAGLLLSIGCTGAVDGAADTMHVTVLQLEFFRNCFQLSSSSNFLVIIFS